MGLVQQCRWAGGWFRFFLLGVGSTEHQNVVELDELDGRGFQELVEKPVISKLLGSGNSMSHKQLHVI